MRSEVERKLYFLAPEDQEAEVVLEVETNDEYQLPVRLLE